MQIKCDHCGAVAETIEPKTARAGELEYTFFRCSACKATYPIAVTDRKLRVNITEYQHRRNHIRISPVTEQFLWEAEALKPCTVLLRKSSQLNTCYSEQFRLK